MRGMTSGLQGCVLTFVGWCFLNKQRVVALLNNTSRQARREQQPDTDMVCLCCKNCSGLIQPSWPSRAPNGVFRFFTEPCNSNKASKGACRATHVRGR
jgi:hypothetical protein